MGNKPCCEFEDRWTDPRIQIEHDESVEDFMYVLARHNPIPVTRGSPPITMIIDKRLDEMQDGGDIDDYEDREKFNITLDECQSLHRSIELVEGGREKNGLIEGHAKAEYKGIWT